jgi:HD-GYP domain-containing protein (c-di-GMP phosphodiesterase class II)
MIRKVKVEQLVPGIFIHDFDASWIKHPFVFGRKKVRDWQTIHGIKESGIHHVFIDTTKGLDIVEKPSIQDLQAAFQSQMKIMQELPAKPKKVSLREELKHAEHIKDDARIIISKMMRDIQKGKTIEVSRVSDVVEQMVDSIFRNQDALLNLLRIRQKDEYTFMHSINAGVIMINFCKALDMTKDAIREFGIGAMLHDIGKARIPMEIIAKPGKLDEKEYRLIKKHVQYSKGILENTSNIPVSALEIASQHHERMDGSGYPQGISGDQISMAGRMAAIVDVYDAMTAQRSYSNGIEPHFAIKTLFELSKSKFDEDLIHQFIRAMGIYPVGSIVSLQSGLVGMVVESGCENALQPVVRVFYDSRKKVMLSPRDLDITQGIGNAHSIKYSLTASEWQALQVSGVPALDMNSTVSAEP